MCPMTGISASRRDLTRSALLRPPSILTAAAPPSLRKRPAFLTASRRPVWNDRYGMSPTTRARRAARATARVWWSISSMDRQRALEAEDRVPQAVADQEDVDSGDIQDAR